jgi:hypothetical protein
VFETRFKTAIIMSHLLFPAYIQETLPFLVLLFPRQIVFHDPNKKKMMAVSNIESAISLMRQLPTAHQFESNLVKAERILNDFLRDRARKRPSTATEYLQSAKRMKH